MNWEAMGLTRFQCTYDSLSKNFKLIDLWHESIKNIPENEIDKVIPDDSPALRILSTEEINAILEAIKKIGWLDKYINNEAVPNSTYQGRKTLQEVAIGEISIIAQKDVNTTDPSVSREAIVAIREVINRIG